MVKHKKENRRDSLKHQSARDQELSITVDSGKLPTWSVFMAITMAYAESKAFLEYALGSSDFSDQFINLKYRMHFTNPTTGERRVVVQRGGEDSKEAVALDWGFAISILTLIRLQNYTATYGESGVIGLFFGFGGDSDRKSDMDRMILLLEERPEFGMLNLSNNLEEATDAEAKEEDQKEEAASLSAPAS